MCDKHNNHNIHNIRDRIKKIIYTIRMFDWLLDMYVVDYFVESHWEKLPQSWQDCFNNMNPSDIGHIVSDAGEHEPFTSSSILPLPLSFMALLKVVNALSISRKLSSDKLTDNNMLHCSSNPKLHNLLLKHVKMKKRHEIHAVSELVSELARNTKCQGVIDFGSGLGHLIRVLTYKHNLVTAGIEGQLKLSSEARKLDEELEYTAKKYLSQENVRKLHQPLHINLTLSPGEQLNLKLPKNIQEYGLTGLHPCGDLGPLLLRHFVMSPQVKYVCVVGCCYMKLSCDDKSEKRGYPLSDYVLSLAGHHLSYASREIACHAIEMYCDRLKSGNYEDLKVHAYRAALEVVLAASEPSLRHGQVRSVKHTPTLTFQTYCEVAIPRVAGAAPADAAAVAAAGALATRDWRRVVMLYSLRLALAPLVESLLHLDRALYLLDHGFHCEIRPIFDPRLSARNHVLIARRL